MTRALVPFALVPPHGVPGFNGGIEYVYLV